MSVVPTSPAAVPAIPDGLDTGLEDIETSDLVMPRLTIDHKEAVFEDSLSGETFAKLEVVTLGFIRNRVLWPATQGDNDVPMCRSYDGKIGHPVEDEFPWDATGFDKSAAPKDEQGGICLTCEACPLKEWGSHPKSENPWCAEQHVFPLLLSSGPALFTVQRSALKGSRAYVSSFARKKEPFYTVITELSLDARRKGSNNYAVPQFRVLGPTDPANWGEYAHQFRTIKEFVQTPRSKEETEAETHAAAAQQAQQAPAQAAPTQAAAAQDDDLPF